MKSKGMDNFPAHVKGLKKAINEECIKKKKFSVLIFTIQQNNLINQKLTFMGNRIHY